MKVESFLKFSARMAANSDCTEEEGILNPAPLTAVGLAFSPWKELNFKTTNTLKNCYERIKPAVAEALLMRALLGPSPRAAEIE